MGIQSEIPAQIIAGADTEVTLHRTHTEGSVAILTAYEKIEFIGIDNIEHNNVQNTYEISMKAKFVDQNLKNIFLDKEHIKVKQDGEYIDDFDIEFNKIEDKKN